MAEDDEAPSQNGFFTVVKRRAIVVVFITIMSVVLGLVYSFTRTPTFEAEAQIQVAAPLFAANENNASPDVQEAIQTLESDQLRTQVMENLGLRTEPAPADAFATTQPDVVAVRVRATNASTAATQANAYTDVYVEITRQEARRVLDDAVAHQVLEIMRISNEMLVTEKDDPAYETMAKQLAEEQEILSQARLEVALETGGASIVEPATPPDTPLQATPLRTVIAVALGAGLVLGLAAAFGVDYLFRRREAKATESDDQS